MQTYTHTRGKPLFSETSYKKLRESAWNLWKPERSRSRDSYRQLDTIL